MEVEAYRSNLLGYFYRVANKSMNFHRHIHQSFELVFVQQGQLLCEIDGQSFTVAANECVLIFPGQIHAYQTSCFSKCLVFIFSQDWVQTFYEEIRGKRFSAPICREICLSRIEQLWREEDNHFLRKALLYEICGLFYRDCTLVPINQAEFALANSISHYIQEHYTSKVTLRDMARALGYHYCYLSDFFNRAFGSGFSQYLNRYQLQYAKYYLEHTDKPITEISGLCGFDTIRTFNRAFRTETGTTPREYRHNVHSGSSK